MSSENIGVTVKRARMTQELNQTIVHTPPTMQDLSYTTGLATHQQYLFDRMRNILNEYEETQAVGQFSAGANRGLTTDYGMYKSKRSLKFNDPINYRRRLFPEVSTDVFDIICATMPEEKLVAQYLFDTRYNSMRNLVVHKCGAKFFMLNRREILTLSHSTHICHEVIKHVALLNWREGQTDDTKSCHWTLPPTYARLASSTSISDEEINLRAFGKDHAFLGAPELCKTISFPIEDENHWYLCTVDMEGSRIAISDTCRTETTEVARMLKAKCLVERLEKVAKLWGLGTFKKSNWSGFQYVRSFATQEGESHDAGLYVILMLMFPGVHIRPLIEGESMSTRKRLATKLYRSKFNEQEQAQNITFVILSDFGEHRVNYFFSPDTTLSETVEYIVTSLRLNTRLDEEPKLRAKPLREYELITLSDVFDLQHLVKEYTKENGVTIPLKLEMVPMPRSLIWFVVKRRGFIDLCVDVSPSDIDLEKLERKIRIEFELQFEMRVSIKAKDQTLRGEPIVGSRLVQLRTNNILKRFVKTYTEQGRSMITVHYDRI